MGEAAVGRTGGLANGAGLSEHDAHFCAGRARSGGAHVIARVDDARTSAAREILQRYVGGPAVRGAAYGKTAIEASTFGCAPLGVTRLSSKLCGRAARGGRGTQRASDIEPGRDRSGDKPQDSALYIAGGEISLNPQVGTDSDEASRALQTTVPDDARRVTT